MESTSSFICNGYRMIFKPDYYLSAKSGAHKGWIYEHIYVATVNLGRKIRDDEVVHHLDLNRLNNAIQNLIVLSRADHARLHWWLSKHTWKRKPGKEDRFCLHCEKLLTITLKFCSTKCQHDHVIENSPSVEKLTEIMKTSKTMVEAGKKLGVSDNMLRKILKRMNMSRKLIDYR